MILAKFMLYNIMSNKLFKAIEKFAKLSDEQLNVLVRRLYTDPELYEYIYENNLLDVLQQSMPNLPEEELTQRLKKNQNKKEIKSKEVLDFMKEQGSHGLSEFAPQIQKYISLSERGKEEGLDIVEEDESEYMRNLLSLTYNDLFIKIMEFTSDETKLVDFVNTYYTYESYKMDGDNEKADATSKLLAKLLHIMFTITIKGPVVGDLIYNRLMRAWKIRNSDVLDPLLTFVNKPIEQNRRLDMDEYLKEESNVANKPKTKHDKSNEATSVQVKRH